MQHRKCESCCKFSYVSPDGEMGFPGEVQVSVTFAAGQRHTNQIQSICFQNHTTFADKPHVLESSGNFRSPSILEHRVRAPKLAYYQLVNNGQIPEGGPAPVEGTPFDFKEWHTFGERIKACGGVAGHEGYDHCYVVPQDGATGSDIMIVCATTHVLKHRSSIRTDNECLHRPPRMPAIHREFVEGGSPHLQYAAFCLETQAFPDAVHQYPEQVMLHPGEVFESVTDIILGCYEFK